MISRVREARLLVVRAILTTVWLVLIARMAAGHELEIKIFWTIVALLPAFLLIFGHSAWRRVCPISFVSQLPKLLKIRPKTSENRLIGKENWVSKNHIPIQFAFLYLAVCLRLVIFNYQPVLLAEFLLFLLLSAFLTGLIWGGKTWCQYFCPISPVHRFYTSPRGLFEESAHSSDSKLTQSMCRTPSKDGDVSACVGCKKMCPDIDLELAHWNSYSQRGQRFFSYGYPGLVAGYFSFEYISPYSKLSLFPTALAYIALFITISYLVLFILETALTLKKDRKSVQHQITSVTVLLTFNFFYFMVQKNFENIPSAAQTVMSFSLVALSCAWFFRTFRRTSFDHMCESLFKSLSEKLKALKIDFESMLDGRSTADLRPNEVFVLARTLPAFSQEKRLSTYRDMLRETIQNSSHSTHQQHTVLQDFGRFFNITQQEHNAIVQEIEGEIEQSSVGQGEDVLRLKRFESALTDLLSERLRGGGSFEILLQDGEFSQRVKELAHSHNILQSEIDELYDKTLARENAVLHQARSSIVLLERLNVQLNVLSELEDEFDRALGRSIFKGIEERIREVLNSVFHALSEMGDTPAAIDVAMWLSQNVNDKIRFQALQGKRRTDKRWDDLLPLRVLAPLLDHRVKMTEPSNLSNESRAEHMSSLVQESIGYGAAALYLAYKFDRATTTLLLGDLVTATDPVLAQTAQYLKNLPAEADLLAEERNPTVTIQRLGWVWLDDKFDVLDPAVAFRAADSAEIVNYSCGDTFCVEDGAEGGEFIVVISGKFEDISKTGIEKVFGRCEFLRDLSVTQVKGTIRVAEDNSACLRISRTAFEQLGGSSGQLSWLSSRRKVLASSVLSRSEKPEFLQNSYVEIFTGERNERPIQAFVLNAKTCELKVFPGSDRNFKVGDAVKVIFRMPNSFLRHEFSSKILKSEGDALQIDQPEKITAYQPRRKVRVECEVNGKVFTDAFHPFVTADIGTGGASLVFDKQIAELTKDYIAKIVLDISETGQFAVLGRIVRMQSFKLPGDITQFKYGVAFETLEPDVEKKLLRYVFKTLKVQLEVTKIRGELAWQGFRKFRVAQKSPENSSVTSFYLKPLDALPLPSFFPGQFLTFRLQMRSDLGMKSIVRCYSLSDSPAETHYRVSIKRAVSTDPKYPPGVGSHFFHDVVEVGDVIDVGAPAGEFFLNCRQSEPVVLLAGGIGLTPILSMAKAIASQNSEREVWIFHGVRHSGELVAENELRELEKLSSFRVFRCFSEPTEDDKEQKNYQHKGYIGVDLLKQLLPHKQFHFYICGSPPMMSAVIEDLLAWEIPQQQIHFEAFGPSGIQKILSQRTGSATSEAANCYVTFKSAEKKILWDGNYGSLLELAEANGLQVPSGCRVGNCHTCAVSLLSGEVSYSKSLSRAPGEQICLMCIGQPKGDIVVDV